MIKDRRFRSSHDGLGGLHNKSVKKNNLEATEDAAAFFRMKSSCKLWRSWNSQVHNIALPRGNSAETQL